AVSTLSMPGHFTIVFAARPAAIWVCSAIANVIRSASGASSAGAPVTFGVGHGVLGVGIGVSTGVDAVGLPVGDGVGGPLEPGVVKVAVPGRPRLAGQVAGLRREVGIAGQRQYGGLDRREPRVEAQYRALVDAALGVRSLVLGVSVEQEREHVAGQAGRGLDH